MSGLMTSGGWDANPGYGIGWASDNDDPALVNEPSPAAAPRLEIETEDERRRRVVIAAEILIGETLAIFESYSIPLRVCLGKRLDSNERIRRDSNVSKMDSNIQKNVNEFVVGPRWSECAEFDTNLSVLRHSITIRQFARGVTNQLLRRPKRGARTLQRNTTFPRSTILNDHIPIFRNIFLLKFWIVRRREMGYFWICQWRENRESKITRMNIERNKEWWRILWGIFTGSFSCERLQ